MNSPNGKTGTIEIVVKVTQALQNSNQLLTSHTLVFLRLEELGAEVCHHPLFPFITYERQHIHLQH